MIVYGENPGQRQVHGRVRKKSIGEESLEGLRGFSSSWECQEVSEGLRGAKAQAHMQWDRGCYFFLCLERTSDPEVLDTETPGAFSGQLEGIWGTMSPSFSLFLLYFICYGITPDGL